MSRGLGRCVSFRMGRRWEATADGPRAGAVRLRRVGRRCLALPGKGRCRCAGATLFALRAKALQSGAPDLWRIAGESRASKRFPHQGGLAARRGAEPSRVAPQATETHVLPQTERALLLTNPLSHHHPAASAALYRHASLPSLFRGEHPAHAPNTGFPRPQNPNVSPFPSPPHPPNHPAGRPAGSARTRPRDQSLGNPFLGPTSAPPAFPSPKTAAGGRPLLVGLPPSSPLPLQPNRNEAPKPPAHGAWARQPGAEGAGRRHCRPAGGRPLLVGLPPSVSTAAPTEPKRST